MSNLYRGFQSNPDVPGQGAVRRKWHVLFKGCNAVLGHLDSSLRASREAVVRCVAPLGKDRGHCQRDVPCVQPLHGSLKPTI